MLQLVDETARAWHAGKSWWGGSTDLNSASIGIELDNTGDEPFAEAQIVALLALLDELRQRFDHAVASRATGLEQVEACGRAYVAFAREAPLRFDALARFEAHTLPAGVASGNEGGCVLAGDRVHAVLISAIEHGIADGSIRPDLGSPAVTSFALWGSLHGAIQLGATKAAALAHAGIDAAQLVEQCLQMLGRSLARQG